MSAMANMSKISLWSTPNKTLLYNGGAKRRHYIAVATSRRNLVSGLLLMASDRHTVRCADPICPCIDHCDRLFPRSDSA